MKGYSYMYRTGIDAGAYSIKLVVLDGDQTVWNGEQPHHKKVKETAVSLVLEAAETLGIKNDESMLVNVTGSMSHLLNMTASCTISEQSAFTAGFSAHMPSAASMIVLGAQKTMYITKPDGVHFEVKKNSNCSAGTGAFFEEQASRLQIPLEEISSAVSRAESIPDIAGRCSVFSKTDMIHHMQEGVPSEDILLGLCYALARNYKSSVLRNRKPDVPVYFAGGVMKNAGVVRALKELLQLQENEAVVDEYADLLGAYGAALMASCTISIDELVNTIMKETVSADDGSLVPLAQFCRADDSPAFQTVPYVKGEETYLGIDIGSTSINLVLINRNREVVYYSYVKTLGRPLDIVRRELARLKENLPQLGHCAIAVTGSGREYIGRAVNADLVINEITAQTEGALMSHPETDTIFEIGGQDSKYMSVHNGHMTDFEMNKVCAAGTGAFLEEQIGKLGISLPEFAEYALRAKHPAALGNRCTVFIEGSVNQALASGHTLEDVCAGLAYAIASNYLFRVVNRKPLKEHIAIQGGIAYNRAVVCAFRSITGREIHVSPYFAVTGAMGAASLLISRNALAFDAEKNRKLNEILLKKSEESYLRDYHAPSHSGKKIAGVPRVIFLHKMFPLFNGLFTNLGYDVLISPLTNAEIVKKAQQYCTAETCYPVKLIYGHIAWLLEQHADLIVLPRLYTIRHEGSVARKDYACMYMQTSPLLMEQAFHFKERGVQLIMPEFSLNFGKKYMIDSILSIGTQLGIPKPRMIPAAASAVTKLLAHAERLEAIGKESLQGDEPVFVLVSRVYNIIDPVLNMGIEEHLNAIGCRVIHLEHLEASVMHVEHDYPEMYWPFGQHILTGLKLIKALKNMYPIYITNHGCGPDTVIQHFFQNEMEGREYLHLEVDEHTSKVGVITRLEAFLYSLQKQQAVQKETVRDVKPEYTEADCVLIPDYGMYTDVIEKYVRKEIEQKASEKKPCIARSEPLKEHHTFDYAMNKEYYSMLIMLEELLQSMKKGVSYVLAVPVDEGSEVFGQYALLCTQELQRRGYDVKLRTFYIEDLIRRDDYAEIYADLLETEKVHEQSQERNAEKIFVAGEPMCVYKTYINERNLKEIRGKHLSYMPFSELLLFHMKETDRKHEYAKRISTWEKLHDEAMKSCSDTDLYTSAEQLSSAAQGKLDFCIGNAAKYRFAKLLCLSRKTDGAVLLNSAEENTAVILKQLMEAYRKEINVPFITCDLDYEHCASKDDFELLLSR